MVGHKPVTICCCHVIHCVSKKRVNFEYFCQISSKSILIISRYTVLKFMRFFMRHINHIYMMNLPVFLCLYHNLM